MRTIYKRKSELKLDNVDEQLNAVAGRLDPVAPAAHELLQAQPLRWIVLDDQDLFARCRHGFMMRAVLM